MSKTTLLACCSTRDSWVGSSTAWRRTGSGKTVGAAQKYGLPDGIRRINDTDRFVLERLAVGGRCGTGFDDYGRVPQMFRSFRSLNQLAGVVAYPARVLPEGKLKNHIRTWVLKFQFNLPAYLAINRGDVAMQVGTPNPSLLRRFSRAVGPNGFVVVVEADEENAARLQESLASLRWKNVAIVKKGAWSAAGTLNFSRSPAFPGDHKIAINEIVHDNDLRPENEKYEEAPIEVDTLDNIAAANGLERLDYLSITVNGAELEVLRGAEQMLSEMRPRVFSKAHARHRDGTPLNVPIREFLGRFGYVTFRTRGEQTVGNDPDWKRRDGDVYAYQPR